MLNRAPDAQAPYVGASAFATKAGIHASALAKDPTTYEHVPPEAVGNRRQVMVSDQGGKANFVAELKRARHRGARRTTTGSTRCSARSRSARPRATPMRARMPASSFWRGACWQTVPDFFNVDVASASWSSAATTPSASW